MWFYKILCLYTIVYRTISRGRHVANRQFVVTSLAEIVRSWWKHPKIAELLRYGGEYKCRDSQYDVQDGDLWKDLMAGRYISHLTVNAYIYISVTCINI